MLRSDGKLKNKCLETAGKDQFWLKNTFASKIDPFERNLCNFLTFCNYMSKLISSKKR